MTAHFSIFLGCILYTLWTLSNCHLIMEDGFLGVGVDLSKLGLGKPKKPCPKYENITCQCGSKLKVVTVPVPICSYVRRLKHKCRPCDDMTADNVCPRYRLCKECHLDGGNSCVSCPFGKYGTWCENNCKCKNSATCDRSGKCICPSGYEGMLCEKKSGCQPPTSISPPLNVALQPPEWPVTAVYSCPPEYELSGQAVSTCVDGKWTGQLPECFLKCALLSAPANGRINFSGHSLIAGVTAEITCNQNFRLIGQKTLACMTDGKWSSDLPLCEELATCPDPGNIQYAERTVLPGAVKVGGHFLQDSKLQYKCKAGFQQLGAEKILCGFDGKWSNRLPSCIKVSTLVPDCKTPGSSIIEDEGVPVRIVCPPECADVDDFHLWGTSIYRIGSSVCQAAIHSAKISNIGGQVAVINNGPYSHFTGSYANNIESESFADQDESFRFDRLPSLALRDSEECQRGLYKLEETCVYVSNIIRPYEDAKAVCTNLGLNLEIPSDPEERRRLVTMLNSKGITSVWAESQLHVLNEEKGINETSEETIKDDYLCPVLTIDELDFKLESKQCTEFLDYICIRKTNEKILAMCKDPGHVNNGQTRPVGRVANIFYVGSSIEFSCDSLHYLRGAKTISCTANGTWSDPKPECIKVDACEDPPVPVGGLVTYMPPPKTATAQRSATYISRVPSSRGARMPVGLAPPIPQNVPAATTTAEPEIPLPPGLHRLGSRAMYNCESRYYKLIGSRTRRCQEKGEWSGRPPTCMPICGRSDSPRLPFIVNGNATDIGQWPWQSGIAQYLPDYKRWFLLCGATLLNELWIITAAHCVTIAGTTILIDPQRFQVYLGKYHRTDSKDDEYVQVRKVQEIHIHPDYDPGLFDADIALIQLDAPVRLNSRIQPVCLPTEQTTRENLAPGKKGVVTGWGMNENETYSETLQQAVLPVVSHEVCEKGYEESELPLTVTENMYCAGYAQGRSDTCSGDSGGPMVFPDSSTNERKWVLEGIVSWGSPRGCGNPNQYGGFTTVSKFLDWIHLYF